MQPKSGVPILYDSSGNIINRKPPVDKQARGTHVLGRYDATVTDRLNAEHWMGVDSLSSVAANDPQTRKVIRERTRYEIANNSYARGIIQTVANYYVGPNGPGLSFVYRGENRVTPELKKAATRVEWLWRQWSKARQIGPKLETMVTAMEGDGESFAMKVTGKVNPLTPVSLDVRLFECDWFDFPTLTTGTDVADSGIRTDSNGDPVAYAKLRRHPGSSDAVFIIGEFDWIDADMVFHVFREDRPGQLRGVPRMVASLNTFAQIRRFTLATITAAESAADPAAVVSSQVVPDDSAGDGYQHQDIQFLRGMILDIGENQTITQMKAEHPNAIYDKFIETKLMEASRPFVLPKMLVLGDAAGYNMASGRLDLQAWHRQMNVDRAHILERRFLNPLFSDWLDEALLIPGFLPREFVRSITDWDFGWRWPVPDYVDRLKEAQASATLLKAGLTNLDIEYNKLGYDSTTELNKLGSDIQLLNELGIQVDWQSAGGSGLASGEPVPIDEPNDQPPGGQQSANARFAFVPSRN